MNTDLGVGYQIVIHQIPLPISPVRDLALAVLFLLGLIGNNMVMQTVLFVWKAFKESFELSGGLQ